MSKAIYDVVIIGSGPAGLTAAVYALRANKTVLMLEKFGVGGQAVMSGEVANFPSYKNVTGGELAMNMLSQAEDLGLTLEFDEVVSLDVSADIKIIKTASGEYKTKSIILATGAVPRRLGLTGEEGMIGRGISYCATCDGNFFKGKEVCVVGGGNTAIEDCLYMSKIAKTVHLIHRRDGFRADEISITELKKCKNVVWHLYSEVTELIENPKTRTLGEIKIKDNQTDKEKTLKSDCLFIGVGITPQTKLLKDLVNLDETGYVITDDKMETNVKGVFACGDCRKNALKQIVVACGEGAIAGSYAAKVI